MALFDLDGHEVQGVSRSDEFERWTANLTPEQNSSIYDYLNGLIEGEMARGKGYLSTGILANLVPNGPEDWEGTPLQAIWDHACPHDWLATGYCLGLFVMRTLIERDDAWIVIWPLAGEHETARYFPRVY